MDRRAQRGQAAVEGVAIAVLVAILLAAVSAWLVREVRPPSRPPALVEAAAAPLTRQPGPFDARYPLPPRFATSWNGGGSDEPIGRFLRRVGGGTRDAAVLRWDMERAFDGAFARRLAERGRELIDDPVGELVGPPRGDDFLGPEGPFGRLLENPRVLVDYVQELRGMPLRRAILRMSEDSGGLAADAAIEAGRTALTRRMQAGRRPAPRAPPDRAGGPRG